jgi:tetratricopeptide (TPR) repeat protein
MDSNRLASGRPASLAPSAMDRVRLREARQAFERGDDEAAERGLTRLVGSGLPFADVHYMLGLVHERRGDLDAASARLKDALRINPGYVEAHLALASVCEQRGDFAQSEQHAIRAGQLARPGDGGLDPTTRGKLTNQQAALADALAEAGLQREAIEQYRQALERCPTFHDIRHRFAVALREAGLPFQAMQELQRILDVHPGLVESRIQLGLTCYAMGRIDEARRTWQAVLEDSPMQREARMYLRLVDEGTTVADVSPSAAPTPTSASIAGTAASAAPVAAPSSAPSSAATIGWSTRPLAARREEDRPGPGKSREGDGSPATATLEDDEPIDIALGALFE